MIQYFLKRYWYLLTVYKQTTAADVLVLFIYYIFVVVFQDAFSLLAYSDPWSSPVGCQLDPVQREPVCAALNSAILGEHLYLTFSLILKALVLS